MKRLTPFAFSMVLLLLCVSFAQAKPPVALKMTRGEAQISALKGKADMICPGKKESRSLKVYDVIGAGCEVSTGADSRLEILLPDKSVVRFSEKTKFKLVEADVGEDGKRTVGISVTIGKIWMKVRKALPGRGDKFEVSCQNAVAGVRGTVYRMDVESDQSAMVKVYDGEVQVAGVSGTRKQESAPVVGPPKPVSGPTVVEGPKPVSMEEWVYIVKSMQKIHITSTGQAREPESFSESEDIDAWVKWNKNRDQKY
ncbi:MAG: FecR family protein [Deltaproteobacteria bacterium]